MDKRIRSHLKPTTDSWRVDETYIKVRGQWKYLYRAVDSTGATIDFILNANRNVRAAKRIFRKALTSKHTQAPRVITVDKNPTYPTAFEQLINDSILKRETGIRQTKYQNNIVEQDHRFIKKKTNPMMGFQTFRTADYTIRGIEAMHMIRKGQVESLRRSPVRFVVKWFHELFDLTS